MYRQTFGRDYCEKRAAEWRTKLSQPQGIRISVKQLHTFIYTRFFDFKFMILDFGFMIKL